MGTYFLDTSALVKRYAPESGHTWVQALCDPAQGHQLFISQATLVEVVATFCRKAREGSINTAERDRLIDDFRRDYLSGYSVVIVTTAMYIRAGDLCRNYALRAYDSVQLACALDVRDEAMAAGAPAPIFVCADMDLANHATSEGLATEDPNAHP